MTLFSSLSLISKPNKISNTSSIVSSSSSTLLNNSWSNENVSACGGCGTSKNVMSQNISSILSISVNMNITSLVFSGSCGCN